MTKDKNVREYDDLLVQTALLPVEETIQTPTLNNNLKLKWIFAELLELNLAHQISGESSDEDVE